MDAEKMRKIFEDLDYVHASGTPEELRAAEYLKARCEALGVQAWLEEFRVPMGQIEEAQVLADGEPIPCEGLMERVEQMDWDGARQYLDKLFAGMEMDQVGAVVRELVFRGVKRGLVVLRGIGLRCGIRSGRGLRSGCRIGFWRHAI